MRSRGDDEMHVVQRLAASDAEEEAGRELADLVVVNADLAITVDALESFIGETRHQWSKS